MLSCNSLYHNILRKCIPDRSTSTATRIRQTLIIDTDAGMDDLVAISVLFQNHVMDQEQNEEHSAEVTLNIPYIFTVGGIQNSPRKAERYLQSMFPETKVMSGLVGEHVQKGVEGAPSWLKEARTRLNEFEYKKLGLKSLYEGNSTVMNQAVKDVETTNRQELTIFLQSQPDESVDLMCLGPFTNVASWLSDATTRQLMEVKLRQVWVMGGNLPPSPQQEDLIPPHPEFNFAQDAQAAHFVFSIHSFLEKMWVVPFQTCEQPIEKQAWERCLHNAAETSNVVGQCLQWEGRYDAIKYDVICAFGYVNSPIDAETEGGKTNTIQWEEIVVGIDPATGLVRQRVLGDAKNQEPYPIKFVKWVELLGKKGMLSWIAQSIP